MNEKNIIDYKDINYSLAKEMNDNNIDFEVINFPDVDPILAYEMKMKETN